MADVRLRDLNPAEFNYGVNVAGFLGVGTTSPAYILHVKPGTGNADFVLEKASAASILVQANSTTGKIGTQSNHSLLFLANNDEKMRLLTTGHFGLGTGSSVSTRLHVRGNSDTSDHDCAIRIVDADGTAGSIIPNLQFWTDSQQIYQIRANDTMGLQFRNSSDATKVAFDDDGKVGIGETDPAYQLHVNSGGTGTVAQFKSTSTTAKIMFNNSGSDACFIGSQNNNLFFQTNSTNRMFISTAGNVGIGTTTPVAHLVVGDGTSSETISINKSTSGSATLSFLNAGSTKVYFQADANEHLRIATNNSVKMSILENGNVGIGETSPTETLHVNGNLKVTGTVDVGSSGFSVSSGFILPFGGGTAPSGWLECDGAAVSRSTYSDLFAIIGTIYGAGDGSTTFNLPDLQGRVIMGQGGSVALRTPSDLENIGDTFGSQTHTLTVNEMPSHRHSMTITTDIQGGGSVGDDLRGGNIDEYTRIFRGNTNKTGGGEAHNNIQPSIVINYLIKT